MVGYFVESHGGVKGDEQAHVAKRVEKGPTCCDVGAVPGRSFAMCGDPQATITNRCRFRQCKSGKNSLIYSEDQEQVACVSVLCKLVTRATQNSAYRQRRGGVKGSLSSCGDRFFSSAGSAGAEIDSKPSTLLVELIDQGVRRSRGDLALMTHQCRLDDVGLMGRLFDSQGGGFDVLAWFVERPRETKADGAVEVDGWFVVGGDFEIGPFDFGSLETDQAFGDQCPAQP